MTTFANRILLAVRLNPALYEEVEADRSAMGQAMGVVVLSSLAAGIGSMQRIGAGGLMMGTLSALLGNIIGGVAFVATINHAQVRSDRNASIHGSRPCE